jgi:hypothetical protein
MPLRFRRADFAFLAALLVGAVALWLPRLQGPIDLRHDAGVYYVLGTSIAQGHGYRLLNEPGAIQEVQYPPALPFFAAVHQWVLGTSDPAVVGHALRLSFALLFLIYVAAVYAVSRWYLAPPYAFFVGVVVLLHVYTAWLSDLFHAELPYAAVTMLFFLTVQRSGRQPFGWIAGVLAAIAFLLRSAGVALLAAWVGESVFRRRFRQALLRAAAAAIPFLGWQGYLAQVRSGAEYASPAYEYQRAPYLFYNVDYAENMAYVDPFVPELGRETVAGFARRVGTNLVAMPVGVGEAVSTGTDWSAHKLEQLREAGSPFAFPAWVSYGPPLVLGALVFAGLVILATRGAWLLPLYVAGSVLLITTTPWPGQFERYLAPLTPLLAISLVTALVSARDRLARVAAGRSRRAAAALLPIAAAAILVLQAVPLYKTFTKHRTVALYPGPEGRLREQPLFFYTEGWRAQAASLEWLRHAAGPTEIVATSTPHWAHLRTGLHTVMLPFEADPVEAQRLLEGVPAEYMVVDQIEDLDISRRYGGAVLQRFPDRWQLVYATADSLSRVYRRREPTGAAGNTTAP